MKNYFYYKIVNYLFVMVLFTLILNSIAMGKLNRGIWYYQQPTRDNDSGIFYIPSKDYEGFCGLVTSAMGLKYFIPNIHELLYKKYGEVDFHPDDNRGGLKQEDPYIYNPLTTYTFEDFLGHRYVGRHVDSKGISYSEIEGIFRGIDAEINDYSCQIKWVQFKNFREYLDDGWLIIMNSKQGGGHYILIVGWEGDALNLKNQYYYIWDPWKEPLDLEKNEFKYVNELVGNRNNLGSAKRISAYKISGMKFKEIFKDQREDSTAFGFKFLPEDYPGKAKNIGSKGIWINKSHINNKEIVDFINDLKSKNIDHIFYTVKGKDGTIDFDNLDKMIRNAHKNGIKVHAVVSVLKDASAYSSGKYFKTNKENWIDVRDKNYTIYILKEVIEPLCKYDVDGILLDCLLYPGEGGISRQITDSITEYLVKIRNIMRKYGKTKKLLSATILPKVSNIHDEFGQDITAMSAYLDVVVPLLFTHRYHENPIWVGKQTKYIKNHIVKGCKIWTGIQTIDDNKNFITDLEMRQLIDYSINAGGSGVILFNYPLANWQWDQLEN